MFTLPTLYSARHFLMVLVAGLLFIAGSLHAQLPVPRLLNYQGVLSDNRRTAVADGQYVVTFRIYEDETGGTPLWEEPNAVQTVDGIFETILGDITPLNLTFDRSYWIALELQGEPEMTPRIRFVSVPYAMRSFEAESALSLDPNASGVVRSLNGLEGSLTISGQGLATVTTTGSDVAVIVPNLLPENATDGQIIKWNAGLNAWQAVNLSVATSPRIAGDGSTGAPLDIAQMGATNGQPLIWDAAAGAWGPGEAGVRTEAPLRGDGSTAAPVGLQDGTADGQVLVWDATNSEWRATAQSVVSSEEVQGNGTAADPLRLAKQGATHGHVLRWDDATGGWRPGPAVTVSNPPLKGIGSPDDPLAFVDGSAVGQILFWDGTVWRVTAARGPQAGDLLKWNATSGTWEPAALAVNGIAPLTAGSIWYGDASGRAAERAIGAANQVLVVNGAGTEPVWTSDLVVDSLDVRAARVAGDLTVGDDVAVTGNLDVDGAVVLDSTMVVAETATFNGDLVANDSAAFNGPVRFAQFPEMGLTENAMIVGDVNDRASVLPSTNDPGAVLQQGAGGAPTWSRDLNVDSVNAVAVATSADVIAGGDLTAQGDLTVNGTSAMLPLGSINNAELENSSIDVVYGDGVTGDATVALGGTLNIENTGVVSLTGTPNQVNVDQATGDVTLSLPQDIHTNATPTFDGVTLDNLTAASTSNEIVVSNGGDMETRSFNSFHPGGVLPAGTAPNTTLHWNGTAWVENTTVTADGAGNLTATGNVNAGGDLTAGGNATVTGDLTVNGTSAVLPNGSVSNAELENSTIDVAYGAGVSGDASVALGGTLNLQNTGVTSAIAGNGIAVDQATGDVTFTNTGVLSATGTANQVIVDQSTGDVTFSLPQDIDANATPTFDGLTLDNLTAGSTATELLVTNGGSVESRSFSSLHPGGILPVGTTSNTTLRWDGTAWVENTAVTADGAGNLAATGDVNAGGDLNAGGDAAITGNLTVNGTSAVLPNGSVSNAELENSTIDVAYGAGVNGDASVALGGTLNLQNTGVLSATGTANQVIVDQSTGDVTFSLPQDIDANATPTFDGVTLDNLTAASASNELLVTNGGSVESRSFSSLHPGGILPVGTTSNTTLRWDGTAWVENTNVTADATGNLSATGDVNAGGDLTAGGNATITGDLTVNGTSAVLPNGSVSNAELENSTIDVAYGAGVSGDASVALGGTLNLQNTGVTSAIAGNGIAVDQATGDVTFTNTGVLSATGTANQVIVDQSTGDVTFSLPQDIDANATPTFDGLTLDNLTAASTSNELLVTNGGSVESRSFSSFHPGGILPAGTATDATLRWNGTAWVENTNVTADAAGNLGATGDVNAGGDLTAGGSATVTGDLVVNGTSAVLPNGSVSNAELENSTIGLAYGAGVSGDATVALGGTLNLQNTGVTSAIAGNGIAVDQATGDVTFTNTGVLSATGTANQVIVDQSTGNVTFSLPQDIDANATPTFDGITLDNLTAASTSNELLVTNGGSVESRSFSSFHPGGILPAGTATDATLRWNGTAWVENTNVTADAAGNLGATGDVNAGGDLTAGGNATITGDLTVNGTSAVLPNGSVSNAELENSTIGLAYGAGVSGDATVALGGTLNLQNTGVTSAIAGNGIAVDQATGDVTFTNTGVLSATGTANQVIVDQSTGDVTFSLPQDIDANATPTFDGLTLDNLTAGSTSDELLVSNGGAVQSRTVASLAAEFDTEFWTTDGNAGTTAGTHFVGTTDDEPLQIHVDNANSNATNGRGRVMRYEPNATSANIIGGFKSNTVASGTVGATISGGGRNTNVNSISADYGTIAGGHSNVIETGATNGTIAGGIGHEIRSSATNGTISGGNNNEIQASATSVTIGGGSNNTVQTTSSTSTIAGGSSNTIQSGTSTATIGGGSSNTIQTGASTSTIAGGSGHMMSANTSFIGGGDNANIGTNSRWSAIVGGHNNRIANDAYESTIGAGEGNDVMANSVRSTVSGGSFNDIGTNSGNSTISGGYGQAIGNNADRSTIGGGMSNAIRQGASISTINGGMNNVIDTSANTSTIGGGSGNFIDATLSTIGGGSSNAIRQGATQATIAGGNTNTIDTSASQSAIGGGSSNLIDNSASQATIAGGVSNTINTSATAATIGGGNTNVIGSTATYATVSGGRTNTVNSGATYAAIGGGQSNSISASVLHATIGGGQSNAISANTSTIGGGSTNAIGAGSTNSTIAGGASNSIGAGSSIATIGGGQNNTIGAGAFRATLAGGFQNDITANGRWSTIGGGEQNRIDALSATIAGGTHDTIESGAQNSFIGGGDLNDVRQNSIFSSIIGGRNNEVDTGSTFAFIGGGEFNTTQGDDALVAGGRSNTATGDRTAILGGRGLTLSGNGSVGFLGANTGSNNMTVADANVAVFGNTDLYLANNDNGASALRFYEANATTGAFPPATTNYSSFEAGAQTADVRYILPDTAGITGDFLKVSAIAGTQVTLDWGTAQSINVSDSAWSLTGNTGTTAGTHFIGTRDDEPFQIHVDNANTTGTDGRGRVMRFEPNATSANIIGGYQGNTVAMSMVAVTIGGGGQNGGTNQIASSYSTVSGGAANTIGTSSVNSTISGGLTNTIGNNAHDATIGGGRNNLIGSAAYVTTIAGGDTNRIMPNAHRSTISGGINNTIDTGSWQVTIGGGAANYVGETSRDVTVSGGGLNWVGSNAPWGVISGGYRNYIRDNAQNAVISGGIHDTIYENADYSSIGGGASNTIGVASSSAVIGGGWVNVIRDTSANSTISGGVLNTIQGQSGNSAIGGGYANYIDSSSISATIAGGYEDTVGVNSFMSAIGGGTENVIGDDSWHSTIAGGGGNEIGNTSAGGAIGGGSGNIIGDNARLSAIPGGRGLTLNGPGSFGFLGNNDAGTRDMTVADANTSVIGNTDLWLANNDNGASALRFYEANNTVGSFPPVTTNYSSFQAGAQTADIQYLLPDTAGIVGDVLKVRAVAGTQVTMDWGTSSSINVSDSAWMMTGNTGTTAGTHFVGTRDDEPFQIHVDNANTTGTDGRGRVMRFEPNATSANIIGGFQGNTVAGGVVSATIGGGGQNGGVNSISSNYGTIGGGRGNSIGASSINATISGGVSNQVGGSAGNGTIAGGLGNVIVSGDHTTISGGFSNDISAGSFGSTLSGGTNNGTASHTTVVGGGNANTIGTSAQFSVIDGGNSNTINNSAFQSTIGGGVNNTVSASTTNATIVGGQSNTVSGSYSTILGGRGLTLSGAGGVGFLGNNSGGANDMTVATANVAVFGNTDVWLANNDNAASTLRFYEANATTGAFPGTTNYTSFGAQAQAADIDYLLPAAAGALGDQLTISAVAGSTVTLGWAAASDRNVKERFLTIDGESVLRKFSGLELGSWQYRNDPSGRRHYGIMAQDFHSLFGYDGLGTIGTDTTVNDIDLHGVSFLAIQGLEKRTSENRTEIEATNVELDELKEMVRALKSEVDALREENKSLRERVD